MLELAPQRTAATRASLLMHAAFARDQAVGVAGLAGITLQGIDDFDAAIRAAWVELEREAPPAHP